MLLDTDDLALDTDNDQIEDRSERDDPGGNLLSIYFEQMGREHLLTAQEEFELAKQIEDAKEAKLLSGLDDAELERIIQDGQAAWQHLVCANTRLVVSIAKRYIDKGLPLGDLIQEGNLGLMHAADKFDYRLGNRFS